MPEYLAPGVYVEETTFRSQSIEGVSTSTTGFVGSAQYGPTTGTPELVTSFAEFERAFGGDDQLQFDTEDDPAHNYLAQGVRAFFDNGGKRLYISRIYQAPDDTSAVRTRLGTLPDGTTTDELYGRAWSAVNGSGTERLLLVARYPGSGGNMRLSFTFHVSESVLGTEPDLVNPGTSHLVLKGVGSNELVWLASPDSTPGEDTAGTLYWTEKYFDDVTSRYQWRLHPEGDDGTASTFTGRLAIATLSTADTIRRVTVTVEAAFLDDRGRIVRRDAWEALTFHPEHRSSLSTVFSTDLPSRTLELSVPVVLYPMLGAADPTGPAIARLLLDSLPAAAVSFPVAFSSAAQRADGKTTLFTLQGGRDGQRPEPDLFRGDALQPDRKTGLEALADIADISIIAAPGHTVAAATADPTEARNRALAIMGNLITHCERVRYSIAVLDPMPGQGLSDVRALRAQIDSTRAALYYPFVRILDPVTDREIVLPPSGFVSGIYARNDVENGVHKAPANEVVRGAIGFEFGINKEQQDVLNPEGINCLRFFEGRGYRVWGARTASSDPEWKYVNVRRYFLYLERSIDRGTQWVVFENNGDALWSNVRRTIEGFLYNEWNSGHVLGTKPELAYFVRCDRSTMTQNDLDNGRLVCLIGVAPLKPAEFVIFRVGQWTADRTA